MKTLGFSMTIAIAAVLAAPAAMSATMYTVDFNTDAAGNPIVAGQIMDDEYAAWGLTITAVSNKPPLNAAVAFDTDNITGGDYDLAGGDGMVAIIEENSIDGDNDGFLDDTSSNAPDDERRGGVISLHVDKVFREFGIDFIDIEKEGEIAIDFYNASNMLVGSLDLSAVNGYTYADSSVNTVSPINIQGWGANRADVKFTTSGAIDNLKFSAVPEPATMTLLGGGIAAMAVARRLRNRKQS